ncbi:MAG: ParA family protein, partial [Desulfobacterales bacterium]|nr:ParA family protein [Desulfobacterales bacterium]
YMIKSEAIFHVKVTKTKLALCQETPGQRVKIRAPGLHLKPPFAFHAPKLFIEQARKEYHLIVIDCNPSTSFLTGCALEVASNLLVPVRPDKYSVLGVEMVFEYAQIHMAQGLFQISEYY